MRPALLLILLVACATGDDGGDGRDWTTTRTTVGDTTIVRTVGGSETSGARTLVSELAIGSVDAPEAEYSIGQISELDVGTRGEIYAFDRQVPALRMYDTTGRYVRTLGRKGAGPGEYERLSGLAVHRDGRVAVWDGATARINIYAPTGEFLTAWPYPGGAGFASSRAVFFDSAGFTYARARLASAPPPERASGTRVSASRFGLFKWGVDGSLVDTLEPPVAPTDDARLMAQRDNSVIVTSVPFMPMTTWAWSPFGYLVSAHTGRYAITLHRPTGGPLRIERDLGSVAVTGEERANHEEVVTASMRQLDPAWRWSGPAIPDTKPFLQTMRVGRDGRVWAMVSQPGQRIPDAELPAPPREPGAPPRPPAMRWREPTVYDVFAPEGEFLGRIAVPPRTTLFAMDGDRAWGITRDSLDVQQITRFRVTPGFPR